MKKFFVEKTFCSYLLLGLSWFFSQNSRAFLKNCYFIVSFKNWLKCYVWLLCCKVCLPIFEKKSNFQSGQKSRENRTNMNIIISFEAKPVDNHGITLVHITYPPLGIYLPAFCKPQRVACNVNNQSSSSVSESQESGIPSGMSPKIFKELPDNVKEPFPLHMSNEIPPDFVLSLPAMTVKRCYHHIHSQNLTHLLMSYPKESV